LPSFGEKLKQEREKRKITLEQISSSTKIGTRMLQALEEDKFNQLPGGIFNKGFVRAYSRCVGLDEDQTVAEYLQASGDLPPVATEIQVREDNAREDEARENALRVARLDVAGSDDTPRQLPWGWFAAILLVIALALSLWSHRRQENAKRIFRSIPTPTVSQASGNPSAVSTADQAKNHTDAAAGGAQGATGSSASVVPGTVSITPPAAQASPYPQPDTSPSGTPVSRSTAAAQSPAQDEFQVLVHARDESWIRTRIDGASGSSEVLAAGTERTLRAHKELVLKVGNAGGVNLSFNGRKLAFGGESGEVKTITFGPLGPLPNAPEPPSTP